MRQLADTSEQEIRTGQYARYRGEEYQAGYSFEDKTYTLTSLDKQVVEHEFELFAEGRYFRDVPASEIEALYEIETFGLYKGEKVMLFSYWQGQYELRTGSRKLADELGFELAEPGIYRKMIPTDDIERVWEEKTPARIIM